MDASHVESLICSKDILNPVTKISLQMASILVAAHIFHLALKVFYNSGPVAQILAGLVLGPVGLSRIVEVRDFFAQYSTLQYYPILGFCFSMLFMFHIGLEVDMSYTIRTLKTACTISYWGLGLCFILGWISSYFLRRYEFLELTGTNFVYGLFVIMFLAVTSPPAVSRVVSETKIATSELGRLAISCALVNDLSCLLLYVLVVAFLNGKSFGRGILALLITCIAIFLNRYLANWFNQRNRSQKYLRHPEFFVLLSLVVVPAGLIELLSYNSSLICFLLGALFPREGKSIRTLLYKLTYMIHNFVLPLYFGFIGFQFSVTYFMKWQNAVAIAAMVVVNLLAKIGGSVAACHYLKRPLGEGVLIGFLLNMKGHVDILLLNGITERLIWTMASKDMLIITIALNTITSGIGIAIYITKEQHKLSQVHRTLEPQDPDDELRAVACVYSPRHAPAMISTISALKGSKSAPITPYLIHLVELSEKDKSSKSLYHELEASDELNEDDYGGNDVLEINDAVDAFAADNKVYIQQIKAVSSFGLMYEDVCDAAEDLRVSLILMPFHKYQRIDGKMESGKDGIRTTNQRVLRHAPCSVGIVISRGPAGVPTFTKILSSEVVQQVATLFFGGSDDQEALACSKRIAAHPSVNLTVIRFTPTSPTADQNKSNLEDDVYLADFYNRFVRGGKVGYIEKHVNNGSETMATLREIGNTYSLFIVGKGRRGHSPMTTGMSDWEECPELGIVGDILASSEFSVGGSVLIIQQHRNPNM